MIIHNVAQGSPEWLALRLNHFTASEAPAMMGASKYQTRTQLLDLKKTGISPDVDSGTQRRFDDGHATEASARPIIEALIGEELFPIVATEGDLLASVDGANMMMDALFEHKLWNEELAEKVRAKDLDPHYYWQMEQQMLVTGASRVIFVCSDGTEDRLEWMEYAPFEGRTKMLLAGWEQFKADLAEHVPTQAKVEVVGTAPDSLPALHIEVTGMVKASNLAEFKATAKKAIESISTDLQTDQDFANAEQAVKWCGDVEERLEAAKQHALSQTATIDELFRTIDAIREDTRAKRLNLEKLVKARKESIKVEIKQEAEQALIKHVKAANERVARVTLPTVQADFAGAMKNKRTIASLRDSVNTVLAHAKLEVNALAERTLENLSIYDQLAGEHAFLFPDLQQIAHKHADDLTSTIKLRISEHEAVEAKRLETERERKLEEQQTAADPVVQAEQPAAVAAPVAQRKVTPKGKAVAEVIDLMQLVKAVAEGSVPITVLLVNQDELNKHADLGTCFPGCRISKA